MGLEGESCWGHSTKDWESRDRIAALEKEVEALKEAIFHLTRFIGPLSTIENKGRKSILRRYDGSTLLIFERKPDKKNKKPKGLKKRSK